VRNTRRLWASIVFVMILTSASIAGLASGAITPVLGLDLQGGVAVILSAPDGTPADVMETALENIRRRVDAFGVGEPDIFLSGTTIEIQIPGASDSTIEQRSVDLTCITDDEGTYGCGTPEDVEQALGGLEVSSVPSEVCVVTGDGEDLDCLSSAAQAQQAMGGYTVQPETEEEPDASPSGSPSPSGGPAAPADSYCLTDPEGAQPACFDTKADADEALNQLDTEVRSRIYCVTPTLPEPEEEPDPSATPTPTASPSASPEPSGIDLYAKLDLSSAEDLPCNFANEARADTALAALEATHVTSQSCVVSSQGEDLGCFRRVEDAETRRRETGQQRLLDVIGTTARLEQREVLEVVAPGTPAYEGLELTCATEEEQETSRCTGGTLDGEEVVYLDPDTGGKYRLGPVIISGENVDRALAAFATGGTQSNPTPEWQVSFELDDEGARAFGEATTRLAPTRGQIAIALDREVVSDPAVNDPITTGQGVITGGFTEEQARELATLLNAGSLPVDLTRESVRTVSPTLGEESLQQGVVAALAGLALLMIYLLLYYRMLGVVAWMGMTIWAALAIGLVAIAGETFGYALTLAGVAGLVISIGVTADSYIVFFERLKDELRGGRSPRSVVQPAFQRAFRTIVAADIVTALAAVVLYITAASSVRGFALTLGVSVALDLFVVYFFKRPTVYLLSRNRRLAEMRAFGLKAAAAADHEALDSTGDTA
jgi:preprotein translocase subunit SecD